MNNIKDAIKCQSFRSRCKAQCCGPVPIPKEIYKKHIDKVNPEATVMPVDDMIIASCEGLRCAFLDKNYRCKIYKDRPAVCRKFGDESHIGMTCPYQDKNGNKRSRPQRRVIDRRATKYQKQSIQRMKLSIC